MTNNYKFYWKSFSKLTATELYSILHLREQVFILEQDCAYIDADNSDQHCLHLLAFQGNNLCGYLRLAKPGIKYHGPSLGRIVTSQDHRGVGLGHALIQEGIKKIAYKFPNQLITISAQKRLAEYYTRIGFKSEGEVYLEDGIEHIKMVINPVIKYKFKDKLKANLHRPNIFFVLGLIIGGLLIFDAFIKDFETDALSWVAKIDNNYISRSKFNKYLDSIDQTRRSGLLENDPDIVLERMIDEELIIQRAIDIGLLENDSQLRSMIIQKMIESILVEIESFKFSDDDLLDFYNQNSEFFSSSPKLRLIKLSFDINDRDKAILALEFIKNGNLEGANFLSKQDVIKLPNTLLPSTKVREYIGPTLTEIALSLNKGGVSEIIDTDTTLSILILLDKQEALVPPFDEIMEQVETEFLKRKGDELLEDYLNNLRNWYDVIKTKNL